MKSGFQVNHLGTTTPYINNLNSETAMTVNEEYVTSNAFLPVCGFLGLPVQGPH